MTAQHPSVWLTRWLQYRGLNLDHVAAAIAQLEDGSDRAYAVAHLALELYVSCGPDDSNMRLGELGAQLDRVFERPAGFFEQMEQRWRDGGCSQKGRPS